MSREKERARALAAIEQAAASAEIAWPPVTPGPIPLQGLLDSFNLTYEEIPGLTRAAAAARLRQDGIHRDDLLADVSTELAGLIYADHRQAFILVRKDDPVPRRRFTAAHELGHYLLHVPSQPETATEDGFVSTDDAKAVAETGSEADNLQQMEIEANIFAAELLMPEARCRTIAAEVIHQQAMSERYLVIRMASEFLVSREAARWRVRNLGLLKGDA